MRYRSWLLVPGDSERKLGKALAASADVVVVDLEASVPLASKGAAREAAAGWLSVHRKQVLEQAPMSRWVRINSLDSRQWRDDLIAVMPGAPEGIILPRATGTEAMRLIAAELYELEQAHRLTPGSTKIIPVVGETAGSTLTIPSYADAAMPRLAGLAWSPDSLAAAIGATRQHDSKEGWGDPFRLVRAHTLLTAHASGIMSLEMVPGEPEDLKTAKAAARNARADGFTGMLAVHPAQVAEINAAFTLSETEFEQARQSGGALEDADLPLAADRRQADGPQFKLAKQMLGSGAEPRGVDLTPMRVLRST